MRGHDGCGLRVVYRSWYFDCRLRLSAGSRNEAAQWRFVVMGSEESYLRRKKGP